MKRDMDLIRQIVFKIEEDTTGDLNSTELEIPGYTPDQIAYHCELLYEGQYIRGVDASHLGSRYKELLISRLTSKGHDLADAARNDTVWNKVRNIIRDKVGGVTIDVLVQILKSQSLAILGIPPGP